MCTFERYLGLLTTSAQNTDNIVNIGVHVSVHTVFKEIGASFFRS